MAKVQTYVNNNIFEQINDLVMQRKQEGIEEATISNVSSMLLELGLRVYMLQQERKEGGFNQMEFNRVILELVSKSNALNSNTVRLLTKLPELSESESYKSILENVRQYSATQVDKFFSSEEEEVQED